MKALLFLCFCVFILYAAGNGDSSDESPATITLSANIRDQAPGWMSHSSWPSSYWNYSWLDNPSDGNCGTANNSNGWLPSDFEIPLWFFGTVRQPGGDSKQLKGTTYDGELGLVGLVCNKTTWKANNGGGCATLNTTLTSGGTADGTPIGMSPRGTVQSPDTFYHWFHDTYQTFSVPFTFTLNQVPHKARTYTYNNTNFFPIDNQGWKDYNLASDGKNHNFAFCAQMHSYFSYVGGEVFEFSGDDDVFVYLDGKLVIDIGGIHGIKTMSVGLDDLPFLNKGGFYTFDMFYCERHTTNSDIEITTSIQLQCPKDLYDQCQVCNGDGSSCCKGDILAACNDNDACTSDFCGVTAGNCTHTRISCNPENQCRTASCDKNNGCQRGDKLCDDQDACTYNLCNNGSGCYYPTIPGCEANACYSGKCDKVQGCQLTMNNIDTQCGVSNACVQWGCNNKTGCYKMHEVTCTNTDPCTQNTCNPSSGQCEPTDMTQTLCTAAKPCQNTICTKGVCSYPQVDCGSGDACTNAFCDVTTGRCKNETLTCADTSNCKNGTCLPKDKCHTVSQSCVGTNSSSCTQNPKACPHDACSGVSSCNISTGGCTVPQPLFPGQTCTDCNGTACNWTDPCNPRKCVSGVCTIVPFTCTAPSACATSVCKTNATTGAPYCDVEQIVCSDDTMADACTPVTCDLKQGCVNTTSTCEDYNPCTVDTCQGPGNCSNVVSLSLCDDQNVCTNDFCNSAFSTLPQACYHTNVSCPAPDLCSMVGECDPKTGCPQATPKPCTVDNLCQIPQCDNRTGNCFSINKTCLVTDPDCYVGVCNIKDGSCSQQKRSHFGTITSDKKGGKTCLLAYDPKAVAGITAGAAAGIAIGGAAAIGLIGFGGKKGYDIWQAHAQTMSSGVSNNPLYEASENSGTNPLYGSDA